MPNKVLETKNLNAFYGDFQALFEISIDLFEGEIISIIGANGVPASYGGWDQLLEAFSKVTDDNVRFVIFCTYKTNQNHRSNYNNATIEVVKLDANGWQSIPYDIISLFRAYCTADVTIMLGTSGCIALPLFRLLGQKVILNIDGAEWRRGKWGYFVKKFLKINDLRQRSQKIERRASVKLSQLIFRLLLVRT